MKLLPTVLLAFAAVALANPIGQPDAAAAAAAEPEVPEKRASQSCKVARRFWPDLHGICVDTTKAHPCDNGPPLAPKYLVLYLSERLTRAHRQALSRPRMSSSLPRSPVCTYHEASKLLCHSRWGTSIKLVLEPAN